MDRQHGSTAPDVGRAEREVPLYAAHDAPASVAPPALLTTAPRVIGRHSELTPGVHLAPWTGPEGEPVLLVVRHDRSLVGHHPWVVPKVVLEATIAHAWAVLERLDAA